MRRFIRENGLTLTFLALFAAALTAQAIAGHAEFNNDQADHGGSPISFWRYVFSSAYGAGGDGELAVRVPAVHALHPR